MKQLLLALALPCASLPACLFVAEDAPPRRSDYSGTLVVDWTVNGMTDGDQCDQGDASSLSLSLFTSSGSHVGTFVDPCDAFSTSIELNPGRYYAEAVLEDAAGHARTTPVLIDDFSILGADTLSLPIDFPASSFY